MLGNGVHLVVCGFEECRGSSQPQLTEVFDRASIVVSVAKASEMLFAHTGEFGEFRHGPGM